MPRFSLPNFIASLTVCAGLNSRCPAKFLASELLPFATKNAIVVNAAIPTPIPILVLFESCFFLLLSLFCFTNSSGLFYGIVTLLLVPPVTVFINEFGATPVNLILFTIASSIFSFQNFPYTIYKT